MRQLGSIVFRAFLILIFWAAIGLAVNSVRTTGLPWIYVPPEEFSISGVKVKLIDEKEAARFLNDPETIFVDTRHEADYREKHVKSSLFLPEENVEERFLTVQGLMPEDGRYILYCYGPDCDMAEKVAGFLVKNGYKNMMIMASGFSSWEKAGYPVEGQGGKSDR